MELILALIAVVVVYFLYHTLKEYLKNPLHSNQQPINPYQTKQTTIIFDNPYTQIKEQDKANNSEFGVLASILGHLIAVNSKNCDLEKALLQELLSDMSAESKNPKLSVDELLEIANKQNGADSSELDRLCTRYVELTKGEYKKRLKIVEYLFMLGYADGKLDSVEQDCIVDVAAFFELSNEDFNTLFTQFEQEYADEKNISLEKAKEIFGISGEIDSISSEELANIYRKLLKEAKQNIFDNKNINKSFYDVSLPKIHDIDLAYYVICDAQENKNTQEGKNTNE